MSVFPPKSFRFFWWYYVGLGNLRHWSSCLSPKPNHSNLFFTPKDTQVNSLQGLTCGWLLSVFVALASSCQPVQHTWVCVIRIYKSDSFTLCLHHIQCNKQCCFPFWTYKKQFKFTKVTIMWIIRLTSLLTMSSRSGMLTSALTRGILSTSSGKGLCLTLYLMPTSLLGVGRPSGTNTCCGRRRVHVQRQQSCNICVTDGEPQDVWKQQTIVSWENTVRVMFVLDGCLVLRQQMHSVISPSD